MSTMNAGIILAGQQPDFLGTIHRANQAAAAQNDIQRQNALADFYQSNGAAVAQGDQAALNALAGFDPGAAMDVQKQRLGMDATRQNMRINEQELQMRKEHNARAAQKWAMTQDAATVQAEAAKMRRGLMMAGQAYQAGDEQAFQRILQENGVQPFPMAEFPYRAAEYEGMLEGLEAAGSFGKPEQPKPLSSAGKLAADLKAGVITDEQYNAANQKSGMRVQTNPDGSVTFEQGVGVVGGGKTPSERQSTLRLFGGLMNETMPAINAMEDDPRFNPVSARSAAAGAGTAGNIVTTPEARQYEALKRQWAEGVLRIQTGAAATEPEINRVMQTYFPVFGDDPATIAQKRQQRDAFARSLAEGSGNTMQAPGGADTRAGLGGIQPENPIAPRFDPQTPDFSQMSDEELQQYIERGGQ